MIPDRETRLDNTEKERLGIPLEKEAVIFEFDKIIEERCDEFDFELEQLGYTVVSQDMEPAAVSIFNYKVIAYKD